MAVAQLVSLFEALDKEAPIKPIPSSFRNQPSSSRVRLSLQTMFSHSPLRRSPKSSSNMSSTPSSSIRSSPSSTFSSFGSRVRIPPPDLNNTLSPTATTTSVSSPRTYIRRQPSAIDLALEEEKYADEAEIIGLGLLEPRPGATISPSTSSAQCSMMEFMNETMQTPVVLDGIFEVMERA
ncbi:uncharacterized protein Z518_01938 [Rhinocladiella mackenziei CBS 650.93]|uniref:Rhinocladiella mackenziei CBS 650.93 unplaced genomic scaffold supercont1.2, whole genome shotgun sequence n=1 Tax=Rhinocladiella mackenziei CBS 650.93 TaxID=1442369 RepID=A0A0D2JDL8_9EURO|nr:uncharacterized protein Z518_01938 [Rhinocladiella mackenziei CBS 650.93]KIX07285.1 hypothetical protein Z518_01938 [Rhinocladiella mackenziei CBS 650.93]